MSQELKEILESTKSQLSSFIGRSAAEHKALVQRMDQVEVNVARRGMAVDGGHATGIDELCEKLTSEVDSLKKHGRIAIECKSLLPMERKSVILSSGLTHAQGIPEIAAMGREEYRLRQFFRSIPTTAPSIFFLRETTFTSVTSPQTEAGQKSEATGTFTGITVPIECIPAFTHLSRQVFDDLPALKDHIENVLLWLLEKCVEESIVNGSGVSPYPTGLTMAPTAWDLTRLTASDGYTYIDVLEAAAAQLHDLGYRCDLFIVNPSDWSKMRREKDSTGRYLLGDPKVSTPQVLWDRPVVDSPSMAEGYFLAVDSRKFHIRQRMDSVVEASFEHDQNWVKNLVTLRAEQRMAFICQRPDAAIYGSFSQSPL